MPEHRGLLGLHSNAGITFDLEAIRRAHDGRAMARFQATLAKDCDSLADVWIFVDGRLEFKFTLKPTQRGWSGSTPVDVALKPADRFLTLVTTDGGDGSQWDWVVYGDPVLLWAAEEPQKEAMRR